MASISKKRKVRTNNGHGMLFEYLMIDLYGTSCLIAIFADNLFNYHTHFSLKLNMYMTIAIPLKGRVLTL